MSERHIKCDYPHQKISPMAWVHPEANLMGRVEVRAGASVGRATLMDGCFIGPDCQVADDVFIGMGAKLVEAVTANRGAQFGARSIAFHYTALGAYSCTGVDAILCARSVIKPYETVIAKRICRTPHENFLDILEGPTSLSYSKAFDAAVAYLRAISTSRKISKELRDEAKRLLILAPNWRLKHPLHFEALLDEIQVLSHDVLSCSGIAEPDYGKKLTKQWAGDQEMIDAGLEENILKFRKAS